MSRQLLLYTFGSDARFEGQLVGAFERIESGGALRVLDALFIASGPETGELIAIDLRGGAGGIVAELLDFQLDPASRRRGHRARSAPRARAASRPRRSTSWARRWIRAAMLALLLEHAWAETLEDAVSRTAGRRWQAISSSTTLAELGPAVVAQLTRHGVTENHP